MDSKVQVSHVIEGKFLD